MRSEKQRVARNSVLVAVIITGFKFVVGFFSGSLGILSEALHSSLDLVAAIVTLVSVRVSDKPADADHQYGHGKVENFSAFIETGLLLSTCVWIVWEAIHRLFFRTVEIEPTIWAVLVMGLSIVLDYGRSRSLKRVADKYSSQALQADALHFATDIWSSSVVIAGLAFVWAGRHFHVPWLAKADPISALGVAAIVVYVSWRLARETLDALLDAAPSGIRNEIISQVRSVPGVLGIERVRIRKAGSRYFADVAVGLARNVTFQASDAVVSQVRQRIHNLLGDSDVLVNAVPREVINESTFDRIRAAALRNNLMVHDISVQDLEGDIHVELHVELDENMSLIAAHDRVTALEADIRSHVPEITSILTHIESEPATIETSDEIVQDRALEEKLKAIGSSFPDVVDVHEIILKRVREHLFLSCHVTMQDYLPLSQVHEVQTALEIKFKLEAPQLFRVLIHPEPQTDNRR
ncbi:MAG TPA: cation diffusion facilitator family transporter [Candidatus Saccharimonadales bacterium]|nr:cation diffusion facilitator family transporter [Candidatus Saccharimonadales bacterium]